MRNRNIILEKYRDKANLLMRKSFEVNDRVISAHKLGYRFEYNNRFRRVLGRCSYSQKIISLSSQYVLQNDVTNEHLIVDTILHEIAHAFAFDLYPLGDVGHDYRWQKIASIIGAKPLRIKKGVIISKKFETRCPNCNNTNYYHRRPKLNKACYYCCTKYSDGKFNEEFRMELFVNKDFLEI